MSRQARTSSWLCAAVAVVAVQSGARAGVITQTSTLPATTTDFSSDSNQVPPLSIQKFDTLQGTRVLDSVTLNFGAQITNKYGFTFTGPATLSESVASSDPKAPTPTVTLFEPDHKTPLITASEPNDPSVLNKSVTFNGVGNRTFSSDLSPQDPNYVAPTKVNASGTQTLSKASDLALFTKTSDAASSILLPVSATAFSKFESSTGNGMGSVSTVGTAAVTVSYTWHPSVPAPETVPEPGALLLWGVAGAAMAVVRRVRTRA